MYFMHDPFYMLIAIVGMALMFIPQLIVKGTFGKYSKINTYCNKTGAEIARNILAQAGITGVEVVETPGELTDHYDPTQKVVRLSTPVYNGRTIGAAGVAAHEIGHVIQDFGGYLPMKLRAGIFPLAQTGQMLAPILLMAGISLRYLGGIGGFSDMAAIAGIILFAGSVLFHIVTLPVEFDASFRAIRALSDGGYLETQELGGAKKVLTAAALTYVATALYSLIELVYWCWRFFGSRRD